MFDMFAMRLKLLIASDSLVTTFWRINIKYHLCIKNNTMKILFTAYY